MTGMLCLARRTVPADESLFMHAVAAHFARNTVACTFPLQGLKVSCSVPH